MGSRAEKYYSDSQYGLQEEHSSSSTRSGRNVKLYKQVYGKYGDLDNLPMDDNTDEIDMEKLRELVTHNENKHQEVEQVENLHILDTRKRKIDGERVYDINKILEKAKNENNKLKSTSTNLFNTNYNILSTLGSRELSLTDIERASVKSENRNSSMTEDSKEEKLSMTREIKYQNLLPENHQQEEHGEVDLSLDLFEDLKPTGNTIVTKPIREHETVEMKQIKEEMHSSDTRDIDIIKSDKKEDNDFFTSSYEFSKKDFTVDEDFEDLKNKGGITKIILLVLAITVFIGVIVYFIGTYGLGI